MSAEHKMIVRRFFEEVCNRRKLQVADQLFATKHVYHDPSSSSVGPGPEGMKQLVSACQGSFPDAHWNIDDMLDADDKVVTRWTGRGTHCGDLLGISATGRQVIVPGIWIHRIRRGKIEESWNVWDTLGMFQQLGVTPPLEHTSDYAARQSQ